MTRRVFALLLAASAAVWTGCSSDPTAPDHGAFMKQVEEDRARKDEQFRTLPECDSRDPKACSPVPPAKRSTVVPLKYFAIDDEYSVPASLRLAAQRPVFEMPTSTGLVRRMQRVGVLEFTLKGEPLTLGAFVDEGAQGFNQLFVPFADLTTGTDTYPAGRYLDLHRTSTGIYTIDFNRAYNPYCAYNATYDCPYPPPSNRLKVEIRAGEKVPAV